MDYVSYSIQPQRGLISFLKSIFLNSKDEQSLLEEKEFQFLMDAMKDAKIELENAERLFNYTSDPDLIESAIYQQYAARLRFSYLVKKAKEKNIKSVNITAL
jgi:hypothetical protein